MQYLCHGRAGHIGALLGQAVICQIPTGMLRVTQVNIGDNVHDPAVGLLGQALILTAVAGFHMEDGNMQPLGTNDGQAGIGVTQHQNRIGLNFYHQLIGFCNDVAHGLAQVLAHGIHVHIRIC